MDWLEFTAAIISALAWPVVIGCALVLLRAEISALIPTLRTVRYKQFRLDFGGKLERAAISASKVRRVSTLDSTTSETQQRFNAALVLSPAVALLESWLAVETELHAIAAYHNISQPQSVRALLADLAERQILDSPLFSTLNDLYDIVESLSTTDMTTITAEDARRFNDVSAPLVPTLRALH